MRARGAALIGGLLAACGPTDAPPELYDTLPTAVRLAEMAEQRWDPEQMGFDWQQTVLSYGMHHLSVGSGDDHWAGFYETWLDVALAERWGDPDAPPHFISSDSLSPSILAATALAADAAAPYGPIVATADAYLATVPRSDAGAVVHWGPDHPLLGGDPEAWVDSMFMVGVYMLQRFAQTGDDAWLEAWAEQYLAFVEHCRDPDDHMYRHAWNFGDEVNIPPEAVYWARGNAWVLVSAAEAVRLAGADHPALADVLPRYEEHAAALAALQDDGMWHTVVNSPEGDDYRNYLETSATALIAYGLRLSAAGTPERIDAAVVALGTRLVQWEDGLLHIEGTSLPTNPGDYEYYVGVSQYDDQLTGVGATLMLLTAVHGQERSP